jgi:hypothetical protein
MECFFREEEWNNAQHKNYRNYEDRVEACIACESYYERGHKVAKIAQSLDATTAARFDSIRKGLIHKECEQTLAISCVRDVIYLTRIC